jgi:hypothetical protein
MEELDKGRGRHQRRHQLRQHRFETRWGPGVEFQQRGKVRAEHVGAVQKSAFVLYTEVAGL